MARRKQHPEPVPSPMPDCQDMSASGRVSMPECADREDARAVARRISAYTFAQLCQSGAAPGDHHRERGRAFFAIFNAVRDSALPADTKLLLFVLASRVGRDGRIWVSLEQIAAETGLHENTVHTILSRADMAAEALFSEGGSPEELPRRSDAPLNWRFHSEAAEVLKKYGGRAYR